MGVQADGIDVLPLPQPHLVWTSASRCRDGGKGVLIPHVYASNADLNVGKRLAYSEKRTLSASITTDSARLQVRNNCSKQTLKELAILIR